MYYLLQIIFYVFLSNNKTRHRRKESDTPPLEFVTTHVAPTPKMKDRKNDELYTRHKSDSKKTPLIGILLTLIVIIAVCSIFAYSNLINKEAEKVVATGGSKWKPIFNAKVTEYKVDARNEERLGDGCKHVNIKRIKCIIIISIIFIS